MLPFFEQTHDSFVEAIAHHLGKGSQQAGRIYTERMRNNMVDRTAPFFRNSQRLVDDIEALTDFSLPSLHSHQEIGPTGKFLLRTHDNLFIESVRIPMQAGGTLCVSSQVGCRLGCAFCETGKMGLLRNLTAGEIVSQVHIAKHLLGFNMRNIVFMGMGEPFDNYEAVMQAVKVLTDPKGFGFGKRHLTISTSGLIDGIERFTQEQGETPNLAVSITASEDTLRNRLMPINKKYNLVQLYETMSQYNQKTGREILIAYVLLQGVNDTLEHADSLAAYLRGLSVKINVIPYNQQTRDRFAAPESVTIDQFIQRLRDHGYYTLRRATKGREIMAACGQLGNLELKKQRSQVGLRLFKELNE